MLTLAVLQPDPRATARLADALGSNVRAPVLPDLGEAVERRPQGSLVGLHHRHLPSHRRRSPFEARTTEAEASRLGHSRLLGLHRSGAGPLRGGAATDRCRDPGRPRRLGAGHSGHRQPRSLASAAAGAVQTALEGRLAALGVAVVRWSMEHSFERPSVDELAQSMGLSRSKLARELNRHGLPSPRALLLWGRLFQAARLLQGDTATVEGVAHALGYSTSSALRRAFQQHVGCPPGAISTLGGVARVLQSFFESQEMQSSAAPLVAQAPPRRKARRSPMS